MSSTIFRHSASTEGETWVIFSPFFTIAFIACSFRLRISCRRRSLAFRDTSRIFGLTSLGIFSQALLSLIGAPGGGAPGADIQLPRLHFRGMRERLPCEEVDPSRIPPVEDDESLLLEALLQQRGETVADVVELLLGGVHHRHVQAVEGTVEEGKSHARDRRGLQLPHPHLSEHRVLVPYHSSGIDAQDDRSAGDLRPPPARRTRALGKEAPGTPPGSAFSRKPSRRMSPGGRSASRRQAPSRARSAVSPRPGTPPSPRCAPLRTRRSIRESPRDRNPPAAQGRGA